VVWRAGLDLNPLDVTDPETAQWLETLVWPGQNDRLARLRTAIDIVAAEPPRLVKGDLLADIDALIAEAPNDATLVVMHSSTLVYVPAGRTRRVCREDASAGRLLDLPGRPRRRANPGHRHHGTGKPTAANRSCADGVR
jgi:hypothetical protein